MPSIRYGKFVPENVLHANGLHRKVSVADLVKEASKFDTKNKGRLSQDEFQKAADALKARLGGNSNTAANGGFRYAKGTMREVHQEYLRGNPNKRFSEAQLVNAAKAHDNGDKYLSRAELAAGAIDLQLGVDAGTLSNKLQSLWDRNKFPTKLSREPSTSGLRRFDPGLTARALNDEVESKAFVDEAKGRVLVKVTYTERLPWEGATSKDMRWFAVPLQKLRG